MVDYSSIPLILEQSMVGGELYQLFKSKQFKIRVSSTVPQHCCIVPLSSIAYTVERFADIIDSNGIVNEEFKKRLDGLPSQLHYQHYIFLVSPILGSQEQNNLSILQEQYITSSFHFLPSHNFKECFSSIVDIIKVTHQPVSNIVIERYQKEMSKIISEDLIISALKSAGLTEHEATIIIDGCGSLHALAQCDVHTLCRCTTLDYERAQMLLNVLSK